MEMTQAAPPTPHRCKACSVMRNADVASSFAGIFPNSTPGPCLDRWFVSMEEAPSPSLAFSLNILESMFSHLTRENGDCKGRRCATVTADKWQTGTLPAGWIVCGWNETWREGSYV